MMREMARRAITPGLVTAALISLSAGLVGCGNKGQEADDAVVVPASGENLPTAGNAPNPAAGSSTADTKASPAVTSGPAAVAPVKAEGWGTLKGQVVFGGSPPEVPVLQEKGKAEKNPEYCAKDAPIKSERLLVDAATKGVKGVLIYIPKPTAVNDEAKSARASTDIVFDQVKCMFEPHVLGMMVGSKMTMKSSDEVNHNVNATSLQKNSGFNTVLAAGQSAPFNPSETERGPISVTCDIHPWMQAWWLILDNPYFATTDEKGYFEIKNVPAGTQKIVVWQEATKFVTPAAGENVTVKAGDTTSKTWTIDPGTVKPAK